MPETASAPTGPFTFGSHVVAVPVEVENAASRFRAVVPFTCVKAPPAYIVVPEIARASTLPLASGFQLVATAVEASNAASRSRTVAPFTVVKVPPAYTIEPDWTASEVTVPATFGSKLCSAAVVAL